jgi:hypothetical protein
MQVNGWETTLSPLSGDRFVTIRSPRCHISDGNGLRLMTGVYDAPSAAAE